MEFFYGFEGKPELERKLIFMSIVVICYFACGTTPRALEKLDVKKRTQKKMLLGMAAAKSVCSPFFCDAVRVRVGRSHNSSFPKFLLKMGVFSVSVLHSQKFVCSSRRQTFE